MFVALIMKRQATPCEWENPVRNHGSNILFPANATQDCIVEIYALESRSFGGKRGKIQLLARFTNTHAMGERGVAFSRV